MICNKLRRPNSTPAGAPEIPQNRSKIEPGGPKIEPKLLQIPSGDLTFLRRWLERGYLLPKRRPKKPPRPPNLSQNPLQNPSKSRPGPQKIDVEKRLVFGMDFGWVRTSFWKDFWLIFWTKHAWKLQTHDFDENLKNIAPVEAKRIFSRNRR